MLWATAIDAEYNSPYWGTYKQWQEKGAQVRKGEKGTMVIFWKPYKVDPKTTTSDSGEVVTDDGRRLLLRYSTVFNADQVDNWTPPTVPVLSEEERVASADEFFKNTGSVVKHGGGRAFFRPSADEIHMPAFKSFHDAVSYYATLGHEHVHWTGHKSRLDRILNTGRFGDEAYAMEELIAELGAAYLCATLGLANEPRPDHAQYLTSWLKVLKEDKRAVFHAASKAQAAVEFLNTLQPGAKPEEEGEEEVLGK
jgi:antirestriction protein ArdC